MMQAKPFESLLKWQTTYKINVVNESGYVSKLDTGISILCKLEYVQEHIQDHINYLQECNPSKQFTLAN